MQNKRSYFTRLRSTNVGFFMWNFTVYLCIVFHTSLISQANHLQNSWDKFVVLALLHTRQTRIQLHLPNLVPIPRTTLKTSTCNFKTRADNSLHYVNVPRNFVHDCS